MIQKKLFVRDVVVDCPKAIHYAMSDTSKDKPISVGNGKGTNVDKIIEDIVLSIIHTTGTRTITTQLDLSKTYTVTDPLTEEKYRITITGRPDVIVNDLVGDKIVNKIVEIKYYPGYEEPVPAHIRQVAMYAELYKSNTRTLPEAYLQYFSISKKPLIKKILIENSDTYPVINTDLVKLFNVTNKIKYAVHETMWNLARSIAFKDIGAPLGNFECYLCPYFTVCKENITLQSKNIIEKTSFENMSKNKFVIPDGYITDAKMREATSSAIIMYNELVDQLSL